MKSKSLSAFLTSTASLLVSFILVVSVPLRFVLSLIKPIGWRTALELVMVIAIFFGLLLLIVPLTNDGLSDAFRSDNIHWAVGEDGEKFIQSVGLIAFEILGLVLLGSIAVIAVCTGGSPFNFPVISQARAEGIIERYGLMDKFDEYAELNYIGVHQIRERLHLRRLTTSTDRDELTSTPSSGIWYLLGLAPCVAGSYLLPILWGGSPNFYWIDNAGGVIADSAGYIITLGKGGINLREWPWALPVAGIYYGITMPTCLKYSKLAYNILLISHLEEQDVLLSGPRKRRDP